MKAFLFPGFALALVVVGSCGGEQPATDESATETEQATAEPDSERIADAPRLEIEPGLTMRVLEEGSGETALPGQTAVVHYTGWLHDAGAPDNRGQKFDSSVDRGQHFEFLLGAGQVIAGWDRGVEGMQVGEVRELTIAPDLAYGEEGRPPVIPQNATLVFEVELADVTGGVAPGGD